MAKENDYAENNYYNADRIEMPLNGFCVMLIEMNIEQTFYDNYGNEFWLHAIYVDLFSIRVQI